jgi:hypothetical protein
VSGSLSRASLLARICHAHSTRVLGPDFQACALDNAIREGKRMEITVTIKTTAKLSVSGRVKQDASPMTRNVRVDEGTDEGAAAMTAHSLFSPEQKADLQRARDRVREATELRNAQAQANAGKDQVALDMEPLSLTAAIQAKARAKL